MSHVSKEVYMETPEYKVRLERVDENILFVHVEVEKINKSVVKERRD